MNEQELIEFIDIYNQRLEQIQYDMYIESKHMDLPCDNLLVAMLNEENDLLLSLLHQPCEHKKLISLLEHYLDDNNNSDISKRCRKLGISVSTPPISEPLAEWIFNYNYMLAYPMLGDFEKDDTLLKDNPEKILSYVYIYLRIHYCQHGSDYSFQQPKIDAIYGETFTKPSVFAKWGLLPVDQVRTLYAFDEPVRIYDKVYNKTIFIYMSRPLALIIEKLTNEKHIGTLSVRGKDSRIYEGENHLGNFCEAVEKGLIFSFNISELPTITKLYSDECFDNALWVLKDSQNLTFEELCDDFHTDGETIVTQMIHLEYKDRYITHLDHEYIFYTLEEYEKRVKDPFSKGQARKRIKTFKIDKSMIPLDYPCKMYRFHKDNQEEITVPFLYFVINNFFEHKDLLDEYFSKCI
ncbi:MAG: hypothetical protein K2G89_11540 [Lachnospiraceae bacterium]|nr:hypothetical protein [Lachnospiraceae bacterium]